jgi:hypothetical protein
MQKYLILYNIFCFPILYIHMQENMQEKHMDEINMDDIIHDLYEFYDPSKINIIMIPKSNSKLNGAGYLNPFINHDFSADIKNILKNSGNEIITEMTIVRTPLSTILNLLLNAVSLGQFNMAKQQNNYDDYFHLHLNITTDKGNKYTLEKTEIIILKKGFTNNKDSQELVINNVPNNLSINLLLENTKQKQGVKFFRYSANSNNCQMFINDVIKSNNINNPEYTEFIKQDTSAIFKDNPIFRKLANSVTDIASAANNVSSNGFISNLIKPALSVKGIGKILLGGAEMADMSDIKRLKVRDLKNIIKQNKKLFNRKIGVTNLKKTDLLDLIKELH